MTILAIRNIERTTLRCFLATVFIVTGPLAFPALASDWVQVGVDNSGNSWSVDRASIVREESGVFAWKRIELAVPNPYPPSGELVSVTTYLEITRCAKRTAGVKASRLLAADGSIIASHEAPIERVEWRSIPPDSILEAIMQFVCNPPLMTDHPADVDA